MAGPGSDVRIPETPARRFRTSDRRTEGVTSVSFFGTDPELNTPVVVKVLRPEAFPSPLERQRIVRELKRQVSVPHPSLARVIAADEEGGVVWVARDWIEGQPLSDRIERGTITVDEVARWTSQLAEALGELHRVMLLHRDVRPAHVILALDGRARLIDASCGRFFRGSDGKPVFGTPGFVAPEAASGKLVNARSDLYSLGATAFAMLQGAPPFGTGDDATLLERALRADAPKPTRGPDGLIAAIGSMLAREPRERPFHAQQLVQQLEPFFTATRDAAAAADDDGPPTSAVDEAMVSKAFAITAGPSIVDDEFDDAEVTEVGRTSADESAKPAPAAAPIARVAPPSPNSAAIRAPAPSPNTGAHAVAVAPSSAPAMSMSQGAQSVVRKATLMGMAPVPTGPAAFAAPKAPVAAAPTTDSPLREDSGSRATGASDFDEEENTVVSQDSRIFGHSQPHAQSAHGTAVPPLPDDVSKRVLQKGGNVSAPVEARPVSVPPPPPSRKVTGSIRVPAPPVGVPSLPRPEPEPQFNPLPPNGEATMTANVAAVVSASETSGPNAAVDDVQSNISITEPSGPSFGAYPQPVAEAPAYPGQPYAQQQPVSPQGYAQQSAQPQGYPVHAQQSAPQAAPYPPQGNAAQLGYPAAVAGYPPQGPTGAYPAPNPTGGYPSPHPQATGGYPSPQPNPTGAYPAPPHPTGAYGAVHPNATAAWPQQPPKKSSLLPWIAAGCLIALVAGGTGYGLALRHRPTENPVVESQPNNSTQTPVVTPNNAQQSVVQTALQAAADAAALNAAINAANTAASQTITAVAVDSGVAAVVVNAEPVDSGVLVAANTATNANATQTTANNGSAGASEPVNPTPSGNNNNALATNTHTQANSGARIAPVPSTQTPMQQARAAFTRHEYPQARQILESWVRSHPSDAQAFLLLGDVRFAQGERRPAGDAYRSAIAAGNYASVYWRRLVERQISIGDRAGAINTINDVLRHKPGDRDATRRLQELQGGGAAPATGTRSTGASSVTAFGAPNRTIRR
ncbi:MAG: protein kinase [Polyangiales bacterium]